MFSFLTSAYLIQFQDDLDEVKTTYEALNTQLLEELPKFLDMGSKIYCHCVTEFILLRKLFVGRVTKELLSLMDVSFRVISIMYNTMTATDI